MAPFAGYTDFEDCRRKNADKGDPDAYCGSIQHKVEDKMKNAFNPSEATRMHGRPGKPHSHTQIGATEPTKHTHGRGYHSYGGGLDTATQRRGTGRPGTYREREIPATMGKAIRNMRKQIMKGDPENVGYPPAPLSGGNGSGPKHGHSSKDRSLPEGSRGIVFSHEHSGGETPHHHQATTSPTYHSPYTTAVGSVPMKKELTRWPRSTDNKDWRKHSHTANDPYNSQHGPESHTHDATGRVNTVMGHKQTKFGDKVRTRSRKMWGDTKGPWGKDSQEAGAAHKMIKAEKPILSTKPHGGTHSHAHMNVPAYTHSHGTGSHAPNDKRPDYKGEPFAKGLKGPILEEGKKTDGKYTEDAPYAQAFNADNLTKRALRLSYGPVFDNLRSVIKKAGENVPGNLNEHLKRAHAAIHGREMFNPKYKEMCQQIAAARKVLTALEGELQEAEQQKEGMDGMGVPENKAWAPGERNAYERRTREIDHDRTFGKPKAPAGQTPMSVYETKPGSHPSDTRGIHSHGSFKHSDTSPSHGPIWGPHSHPFNRMPSQSSLGQFRRPGSWVVSTTQPKPKKDKAVSSYPAPKKQGEPFDTHMRRISRQNANMPDAMRGVMGSGDLHEHKGQGSHSHPDAWTKHTHQNRYS